MFICCSLFLFLSIFHFNQFCKCILKDFAVSQCLHVLSCISVERLFPIRQRSDIKTRAQRETDQHVPAAAGLLEEILLCSLHDARCAVQRCRALKITLSLSLNWKMEQFGDNTVFVLCRDTGHSGAVGERDLHQSSQQVRRLHSSQSKHTEASPAPCGYSLWLCLHSNTRLWCSSCLITRVVKPSRCLSVCRLSVCFSGEPRADFSHLLQPFDTPAFNKLYRGQILSCCQ